ncbi:MAG: lactate utilization protein [Chitinophagaceae bacterium]
MNASYSKENILKKIRKALSESTPIPFPQSEGNSSVYHAGREELEVQFAEEFSKLQGKFIYCLDDAEMIARLVQLVQQKEWTRIFCTERSLQRIMHVGSFPLDPQLALKDSDVSITTCECLVARTGTIVLSSAQLNGRTASVYAPIHVCIAYTNQLVPEIRDAMLSLKEKYQQNIPSLITFASGPSRTADIEKTLVVGVHGPREVYVFLVDSASVQ